MSTDIKVISDFNTIKKIDDILISKGLVSLDLEHLPFYEFDYVTQVKTNDLDVAGLRKSFTHVPEKIFNEVIQKMQANSREEYTCNIKIDGKMITLNDGVIELVVELIDTRLVIDYCDGNISECIKDVEMNYISKSLIKSGSEQMEGITSTVEDVTLRRFLEIISFLIYTQLPKEYKEIISINPKKEVKSVPLKKKKHGKKVAYISNIIYKPVINEARFKEHLEARSYTRHTESWYQRGFWRTYKSGKRVWVKPTVKKAKGVTSSEVKQTYKVK